MSNDLLTTVKAEQLRYKRNGCFPSAELADTWIDALVARVEQADAEVKSWQDQEASRGHCCWLNEERANKAEADLATLREQRCETCRFFMDLPSSAAPDTEFYAACDLWTAKDYGVVVWCADIKFCGAWARREP